MFVNFSDKLFDQKSLRFRVPADGEDNTRKMDIATYRLNRPRGQFSKIMSVLTRIKRVFSKFYDHPPFLQQLGKSAI